MAAKKGKLIDVPFTGWFEVCGVIEGVNEDGTKTETKVNFRYRFRSLEPSRCDGTAMEEAVKKLFGNVKFEIEKVKLPVRAFAIHADDYRIRHAYDVEDRWQQLIEENPDKIEDEIEEMLKEELGADDIVFALDVDDAMNDYALFNHVSFFWHYYDGSDAVYADLEAELL